MQCVVYNPLAGGLLSGKIKSKDDVPQDNSRFGTQSSAGENYRARYFRDATFEAVAMIEEVARKHNLTMPEIALRWVMHHSTLDVKDNGGDGIIIGVSSKQQLENNLRDLEKGPLPDEVVTVLDQAWIKCKGTAPNYWHLDLKYTYDTRKALFGQSRSHPKV
jgi:aflatoxin B1 aldehyde reductase